MHTKPIPFPLKINEWWVKPIAMLQHNWAVVEDSESITTVYFFHDGGNTKQPSGFLFTSKDIEKFIAIVDSLTFDNRDEAETALLLNGFAPIKSEDHPFAAYRPNGTPFDARSTESGIYSKEGYWKNLVA